MDNTGGRCFGVRFTVVQQPVVAATSDATRLMTRRLVSQVAAADAAHAKDLRELADLRAQIAELQAAVGQAAEEIEAQNEVAAQQQAAMQDLANQIAARDEEAASRQQNAPPADPQRLEAQQVGPRGRFCASCSDVLDDHRMDHL